MAALFISDLHLAPSRPETTSAFEAFLSGPALQGESLYILGDLFEYWAGDDDLDDAFNARVIAALARCSVQVPVLFMHGNRDFLAGARFASAAGLTLLKDPLVAQISGQRTLIMHGDTLCTDDLEYQRFRSEVRSPEWVAAFLALPLAERKRRIELLREQSEVRKKVKSMTIMDVSAAAVESALRTHACDRLIHGHTHRPGRHSLVVDGRPCERLVLGDWYGQGSHLSCTAEGCITSAD